MLLSEMMAGYNLNIIDDELKNKLEKLTLIGKGIEGKLVKCYE